MREHKWKVITADVVPFTTTRREERKLWIVAGLIELNAFEEELKKFLFCNGEKDYAFNLLRNSYPHVM